MIEYTIYDLEPSIRKEIDYILVPGEPAPCAFYQGIRINKYKNFHELYWDNLEVPELEDYGKSKEKET